ncbi:uncharacterized protein Z518_05236 [Rhinocladiella mackenziei CBS 650.93]|uniref:Zn(2)-C6 fungal-type domain-containing protein n=1 Tax=Rhinocladiella mackenziei CBS 650.93 TaxID=1442369 RepID=A0A0D2H1N6_9EURO|nr:uncharacterized protein Z518_05236 [Rhinocladiella mackenziei CBS 650.93]KIX04368.1 hypothetical protein Z518_05236 [Rhinocladiella mackenziei CBS 650.93]
MDTRREAKRARQACLNCRRKKARCSGEKPVCAFCARLNQECTWDQSSTDPLSKSPPTSSRLDDQNLAARVALLESKLSLLGDNDAFGLFASSGAPSAGVGLMGSVQQTPPGLDQHGRVTGNPSSFRPRNDFLHLPDHGVFQSLIDVYFEYCHNQPYAFFHEATFRRSFEDGLLPEYLLFAIAATACRFTEHPFYQGRQAEAIESYSNTSWSQIFERSFSSEGNPEICIVQATNMLAVIDFTAGHPKLGWVKLALAVRFAQGLRLNEEPDHLRPTIEQEEHRRTFWSVYLLDRLMSLGPDRPPSFPDADCTVRLPCSEDMFINGLTTSIMPTLESVIENPTASNHQDLDHFAMLVLMASTLGRFARFSLKHAANNTHVPWDPRSKFYNVHSSLLHFESLSPCMLASVADILRTNFTFNGQVDKQRAGHFIFSHALFHLNHCLLNHPFILLRLFDPCQAQIPLSFVQEALDRCHKHATELLDLLRDAHQCGPVVHLSFYGYCALVSGVIQRLYASHTSHDIARASSEKVQASMSFLEGKPARWAIFRRMKNLLQNFNPDANTARALTNPVSLSQKTPIADRTILWELLDYARLVEMNNLYPVLNSVSALPPAEMMQEPVIMPPTSNGTNTNPEGLRFNDHVTTPNYTLDGLGEDGGSLWSPPRGNGSTGYRDFAMGYM